MTRINVRLKRIQEAIATGREMTMTQLAEATGISYKNIHVVFNKAVAAGHLKPADRRTRAGKLVYVVNASEASYADSYRIDRWAIPAEVVPKIDELLAAGFSQKRIADALDVHPNTIRSIARRKGAYRGITA